METDVSAGHHHFLKREWPDGSTSLMLRKQSPRSGNFRNGSNSEVAALEQDVRSQEQTSSRRFGMSEKCQNRTFVAGFSRSQATLAERSDDRCPVLPTGPGLLARRLPRHRRHDRGPTCDITPGVARSVLADCLFRSHALVLVWSIQSGRRCDIVG
jgi:hypothetical protein